jgi:hypothetical protein
MGCIATLPPPQRCVPTRSRRLEPSGANQQARKRAGTVPDPSGQRTPRPCPHQRSSRRCALSSTRRTSAPADRATSAMRTPTGDTDGSAADHEEPFALSYVGSADGPALLQRAGGVDAGEVEAPADVLVARPSGRAQVSSRCSGITVTASPGRQPSTPGPPRTIRPDISCPRTAEVARASMSP